MEHGYRKEYNMAIIEFAKAKSAIAKSTMAKEAREKTARIKTTKENSLTEKIAAEIEVMAGIQSEVNAILGERPRATKQQALIAKILTNLESQMKAAEKLETLKKNEAGLRQELADFINVKQKAERKGNG